MRLSFKPFSKNTYGGGSRSSLQADIREISANTSASFVQADSVKTAFVQMDSIKTAFAQVGFVQADFV